MVPQTLQSVMSLCVLFPVIVAFLVFLFYFSLINAHLSHLCLVVLSVFNMYSPGFHPFFARLSPLLPLCSARSLGLWFALCSVLCVYCSFLFCFFACHRAVFFCFFANHFVQHRCDFFLVTPVVTFCSLNTLNSYCCRAFGSSSCLGSA